MLGWAQLLHKREFKDPMVNQAISVIERNALLQKKLIEDLLDISRIIQNRLEIVREPVYLIPLIDTVIETLQPTIKAKAIKIITNFDPSTKQVLGDASRLEQIVGNLLSNAIKFTPNGGQIEVKVQQLGSLAQITVTDTGQGISSEFLPFIFDRFRQSDASKTRKQSGLGLGLAIVRHLVELHGGSVYAASAGEEKGSTFTIQLPTSQTCSIASEEDLTRQIEKFSALFGLKILVVDDDIDNREMIAFILEQQQAQVTLAESAAEAFKLISQLDIDILISDIGMPDEDGHSLIRRIRSLQPVPKCYIPAIALTAFAQEEDLKAAMEAGFQSFLAKPIDSHHLIEVVASLASLSK